MHLTFFPYNKALSFCLNIYNFCTTVSSNPDGAGLGRLQGGKQEQGGALPGAPEKPGQGTMTFSPSLSLSLLLFNLDLSFTLSLSLTFTFLGHGFVLWPRILKLQKKWVG